MSRTRIFEFTSNPLSFTKNGLAALFHVKQAVTFLDFLFPWWSRLSCASCLVSISQTEMFSGLRGTSRVKSFSSCQTHFSKLLEFLVNHSAKTVALSVLLFLVPSLIVVISNAWIVSILFFLPFFSKINDSCQCIFVSLLVTYDSRDFLFASISGLQSSLCFLPMLPIKVFLNCVSYQLLHVF